MKKFWIGKHRAKWFDKYGFMINEGGKYASVGVWYSTNTKAILFYFSIRWFGKWHQYYSALRFKQNSERGAAR